MKALSTHRPTHRRKRRGQAAGLVLALLAMWINPAAFAAGDGAKIYNEYLEKEVIYPNEHNKLIKSVQTVNQQ